jgi:hypothetical protein
MSREICKGCGHEIDPDCCGCGSPMDGHSIYDGHSPVPMGCACGYERETEARAILGPNGECPICGSIECKPGCQDGSEII